MFRILTTIAKKSTPTIFKRHIFTSLLIRNKQQSNEQIQQSNPFCLEYIETKNHTLRPHDNFNRQKLYEFGLYVAACMPKYVQKVQMQHTDELEVLVAPEGLFQVLSFLCHHQHCCFNFCSSVTAIDVLSRPFRFEVIYCLLSLRFGERIRVKTYTDELTPLHSACALWQTCNFFEREVYDMYGVVFTHHPDLRRILTDYGFAGHPLRKDFPLVGYIEVRYDDELKKIVYEPVEFAQEYRRFELESPWNYMKNFHEDCSGAGPVDSPKK